jgi:hypothetical protein
MFWWEMEWDSVREAFIISLLHVWLAVIEKEAAASYIVFVSNIELKLRPIEMSEFIL